MTCCAVAMVGNAQTRDTERFEDFAVDPGWEGFRSQLLPKPLPVTRQDFGWRATVQPNGTRGEIAGWVQRSVKPAWFAKIIPVQTLNDKLSASGTFAVTRDEGFSGVLFGWFNENSRGWRTRNSLVFRLDGNGNRYWVFYEFGTRNWLTGGAGCFEGDRYQTTPTRPFPADGTRHQWSLAYDPEGAEGQGRITFILDDKSYELSVPAEHKSDGAEFNRFGVLNQQTTGSGMDVHFSGLTLNGRALDGPEGWEGRGNRVQFEDRTLRPYHDLGWRGTNTAGGQPGEIGGIMWRDEKPAYYAARTEKLTLDDELLASGKLAFNGAGSDSAVYLGWFGSEAKTNRVDPEGPAKHMLAILLEGPSRVGHYFRGAYRTSTGEGVDQDNGPILQPDGQPHTWSIRYSPRAHGGAGEIVVVLDDKEQRLPLAPGHRQQGAAFDRFGLFNLQRGGHFIDIAIDDLRYSARPR